MDEATLKELGTRYDIAQLLVRAKLEGAGKVYSLDVSLLATRLTVDGWRVSQQEELRAANGQPWRRLVFDAIETPSMRVLIDVVECVSPGEALEALLERLAGNQLPRLDEGPPELGFAVFQHPPVAPPAIFYARDNLCIAVVSFGPLRTAVLPWAKRLVELQEQLFSIQLRPR